MIEITLPWPNKILNPNARPNRYEKAAATRSARRNAWAITFGDGFQEHEYTEDTKFVLQTTFCPPDKRRRDLYDNMPRMCKAYVDGIFDCLELDDWQIKRTISEWGDVTPGGKVILRLEEMK